jgi:hypothetical protein
MAKTRATAADKPITRDDLEASFAGLQSGLKGKVESRKNSIATALGATAVILLLIVFVFGRRSGRRKSTLVEIRRV